MRRTDSLEETLILGKVEYRRRRGWQRMRWLDGITNWRTWVWASSRRWWWTGKPGKHQSIGSQRVGRDWGTNIVTVTAIAAQSCLTLWDSMDCSPPCSSIHGVFQARVLEWVAIPFSRASSQPRDITWVSHTAGRFFTLWATREADRFFTVWDTKWEVALWLFFSF